MKPTQTNCHLCWLDGQRTVPATMVTRDDEFLCDGHVRAEGLDTANLIPIAKWRVDHGMTTGSGSEEIKERIMSEKKCIVDGCENLLRSNNESGRCKEHKYIKAADRVGLEIPAKRIGRPPKAPKPVAKVEPKVMEPVAAAPAQLLRAAAQLREVKEAPAEFVTLQLTVLPAWLDQAWARLDLSQKARALATVLAE